MTIKRKFKDEESATEPALKVSKTSVHQENRDSDRLTRLKLLIDTNVSSH